MLVGVPTSSPVRVGGLCVTACACHAGAFDRAPVNGEYLCDQWVAEQEC